MRLLGDPHAEQTRDCIGLDIIHELMKSGALSEYVEMNASLAVPLDGFWRESNCLSQLAKGRGFVALFEADQRFIEEDDSSAMPGPISVVRRIDKLLRLRVVALERLAQSVVRERVLITSTATHRITKYAVGVFKQPVM